MAMKEEDKLTKEQVIADVLAIIRPAKTKGNGNRGAALIQAMLARAKASQPIRPQGRQLIRPPSGQPAGQIPPPPTTPPV